MHCGQCAKAVSALGATQCAQGAAAERRDEWARGHAQVKAAHDGHAAQQRLALHEALGS